MQIPNPSFKDRVERARQGLRYAVQTAIMAFTEQIVTRMSILDISKSELAAELKVSGPYVSKMLRGDTNFTLESMVKIARSLKSDLEIRICPRTDASDWFPSESVEIVENYKCAKDFSASTENWADVPRGFVRQPSIVTHEIITTGNC